MKRWMYASLAAVSVAFCLAPGPARAQFRYVQPQTSPMSRPPFSPYLNMLRGGNPAVNYYGLVRPQLDTAQNLQQLQEQQNLLGQALVTQSTSQTNLPITGHATQFMNFSHYYPPSVRGVGGHR